MRFFKKVLIPSGQQTDLIAFESWVVRWLSLDGSKGYYSTDKKQEAEVFTTKEDADSFATALTAANKLLRNSGSMTDISVTKNV